jgi:hypothetical protein
LVSHNQNLLTGAYCVLHKCPVAKQLKWTLVLAAMLACTRVVAADKPWTEAELKEAADGCSEGILQPARRDYKSTAAARGDTNPKPFPEQEIRDSVWPMCACIVRRVAEIMTVAEFANGVNERSNSFIMEAMQGGRCKPEGMLGEMLEKARNKKAGG